MMRLPGQPASTMARQKPYGPHPGSFGGLGSPQPGLAAPVPRMVPAPAMPLPAAPMQPQAPLPMPAAPAVMQPGQVPMGATESFAPINAPNRRPGMMGLALRRQAA